MGLRNHGWIQRPHRRVPALLRFSLFVSFSGRRCRFWANWACVALAVFFGLWPDVDTKSKGQYVFLLCVLIADLILIYRQDYKRAAYLGILVMLPVMSRHRGWTHSLLAMILIPGALYLAAVHYSGGKPGDLLPYFLAALLGYASHLILDRF